MVSCWSVYIVYRLDTVGMQRILGEGDDVVAPFELFQEMQVHERELGNFICILTDKTELQFYLLRPPKSLLSGGGTF